jgi:hypothetical protein
MTEEIYIAKVEGFSNRKELAGEEKLINVPQCCAM